MALKLLERRKDGLEEGAEMSFIDHLEELRWHIMRSVIAVLVGAITVFVYIDEVMDVIIFGPIEKGFVTYSWLCEMGHKMGIGDSLCLPTPNIQMQTTTFGGQFVSSITIAFVCGIIVAFPYIFWEVWRFIKPALKPAELKATRGAIFWVTLFFMLGVAFGYFLLAPFTFSFLANYTIGTKNIIETRPALNDYIDNLVDITVGAGLAFELPVVSFVLTRIGLITPRFLREYRKYAYVGLLVIAAVITPSPDLSSQLLVVFPLILLYEFSVIVSARISKKIIAEEEKEWS